MKKLLLPILLVCAAGCEQHPELTPIPRRVAPAEVAQGQERYVIIEGENFIPTLSWESGGGAEVNTSFAVQFGSQPAVEAWPAGANRLTARLPKELPAGSHSVVVQGPGGQAGQLADALCVDDQPFQELIHACLMDITEGVMDICSTSLDGGLHKKVVVRNAVPGIAQGAGTNQTESLWNGFTLSPDGKLLVFMRWTADQTRLRLILHRFDDGQEMTLDEIEVPSGVENPFRLMAPPVFSTDSRKLVYVKNYRQLMLREVPTSIGPLEDPVLLAEEPEHADEDVQVNIVYPDVDPAMRFVLYTRVVSDRLKRFDDVVSLHLVPLSGGKTRMLLEEDPLASKNGPGAFLPSGEGVVFISDRLNLQIPTPFGAMTAATNLYRVDLFGGPVTPLGNPTAAYLYGKPVISPDGRFVATTGFLADVSGSGLDIVLTNLKNGQVSRVLEDPVRYCIPEALVEGCADPVNPQEWVLPCCADPSDSATCCGFFNSGFCPTWDVGPAFTPDSKALYANGLAVQWLCTQEATYGYWYWQGRIANVFLYKATISDTGQTTRLETLPYGLMDMPLGPLVRQTVSPCQ